MLNLNLLKINYFLICFLSIELIFTPSLLAQNVPPLPPNTDPSLIQQELQPPVSPSENQQQITVPQREELTPPAGAEEIKFRLDNLQIVGTTVYKPERLQQFYQQFLGREINLGDLYEIASKITQLYRNEGYILSQAVVPEQTIANGVAKIQVIEGFVERVDFVGSSAIQRNRLTGFGDKIIASRPLNIRTLERYLLLANDLAGFNVQSVLSSGQSFGAAILTINVNHQASNIFFDFNNRGSESVGSLRTQAALLLNSVLGEQFTISGATNPITPSELGSTALSVALPVDFEGLRVTLNGADTNVQPGNELSKFKINGNTYSASLGVTYPFIRSRTRNLYFNSEFEYTNRDVTTLFTGTSEFLNLDRLRILRAGLNFDRLDAKGITTGRVQVSQGIGGLGATTSGTPNQPLSRAQGRADFTKLNLNLTRRQTLSPNFTLDLSGTAQITDNALLVSEQFGLGGDEFGRAFETSQILGDSGYGLRAEIQRQFVSNLAGVGLLGTQPYIFYDYGQVFRKFPTAAENSSDALSSAGLGVRFVVNNALLIQGELGFPLSRTDTNFNRDPRLFFGVRGFF